MLYQAKVNTVNPLSLNIWANIDKAFSLGKIPDNAIVDVLQEYSPTFAKIEYRGIIGYADRQYLVKIAPPAVTDPALINELKQIAARLVEIAEKLRGG